MFFSLFQFFFSPCTSSYLYFSLFSLSCSFLFTYWHDCWAVLPKLLNAAGNLCFFRYLSLWGIGETFSYLSFFICVCCCLCVIRGFFLFFSVMCMCVLPVQHWQNKRPVSPHLHVSSHCLSHPDNNPFRRRECRDGEEGGREEGEAEMRMCGREEGRRYKQQEKGK